MLGETVLRNGGTSDDDRLRYAFRRVLSRSPSPRELKTIQGVYQRQKEIYTKNRNAATQLISNGQQPAAKGLDPIELAAWTNVASVLLNLDEAITRE